MMPPLTLLRLVVAPITAPATAPMAASRCGVLDDRPRRRGRRADNSRRAAGVPRDDPLDAARGRGAAHRRGTRAPAVGRACGAQLRLRGEPASVGETTCCGLNGWACDASARSFFSASSTAGEPLRPQAAPSARMGTSTIQFSFRIAFSAGVGSRTEHPYWHTPFRRLTPVTSRLMRRHRPLA